ncbi:MAG: class I SAM-dependent methyltransferase [Phycisphaeraceae bacterium]|nr:class I SAM-dependent methyltransferase [Phycisphaeraceae bacterium]
MSSPTFSGSVPKTYHDFLGPLIFDAYARDMSARITPLLKSNSRARILELACGTGIVTDSIAQSLPSGASLIATDISEPMLGQARATFRGAPGVTFQTADACALPFKDHAFDILACQYGVMFFPDKVKAMQEARRVLAPGGTYIFNIWDSLEHNPMPRTVHETLASLIPANPIPFLAKLPFGYSDRAEIERVTRAGGFANCNFETVEFPCSAPTASEAARAWVEGTPIFAALIERGIADPSPIRAAVEKALTASFGDKPSRSTMRAIVVTAS